MQQTPNIGTTARLAWTVGAEHAIVLGGLQSGGATVLSTPSLINLMEHAARQLMVPYLEPGEETVGVWLEVEHLAATPLGQTVTAEARLTAMDGRSLDFEIIAHDAAEQVGRARHRRALIKLQRFAAKLAEKSSLLSIPPITAAGEDDSAAPPTLPTLGVKIDHAIARVTLDRPAKRNAVNRQMTADWERLNDWLAAHPEVRIVIVSGAGESFCAGDDVPEVGELSLDEARTLSLRQAAMYLRWEQLPQVFIAAVHGDALGGGCVAAYSCDFRIASHDARFGMPEIKLGWPPGYGIAQLTALVGKARALELCLLGEPIAARQAAEYGLVHRLASRAGLLVAAEELSAGLLQQPAQALRETKWLIHRDEGLVPKVTHRDDTEAYIRCLGQPDAREGIAAFREKRPPRY
ncbi:MAG: enoyl-CoA hydratase-related protein [Planctomycetaceae bacterium]